MIPKADHETLLASKVAYSPLPFMEADRRGVTAGLFGSVFFLPVTEGIRKHREVSCILLCRLL